MRLIDHPQLLDRLAAAYALGSLQHGARRRFESLARTYAPVQAAALLWQVRLAGLTELQPKVTPDPTVWQRIDNLVRADLAQLAQQVTRVAAEPAPATRSTGWRSLALWQTLAFSGILATVLLLLNSGQVESRYRATVADLQNRLAGAAAIEYVAVLSGERAGASILVQFDPKNRRLTLKQIGSLDVASDKSLQLWALPPGQSPRSLGVLGDTPLQRIDASPSAVSGVPTLAISLEPRGGVPSERGPTGPVLYQGALLQTVL